MSGDQGAWRELVDRHGSLVLSLCRASGLGRSDADDVCQEVLISAFRGLGSYGGCRLSTWLYRITRRRIVDWIRRSSRKPTPVGLPGESLFPNLPPSARPNPEEASLAESRRRGLLRAIDGLREPNRTILLAFHLAEVPVREISEEMSMPENTVKSHLRRGRLALGEILENEQ